METFAPTLARVRAYCLKHDLLTPGMVVVAVSGGTDSLALLHILQTLQQDFGMTLHVATFDHGIRGTAGAQDVEAVREIASKWGVPVTAGAADVPALAREWHMGLEEAARKARYGFLRDTAATLGAYMIATGHNQDDQAETVLLHVIRGAGLAGLRGMLPKTPLSETVNLIRPLLDTSRAEIEGYLHDLGIQPQVDATNTDMRYTRNRLRHQILPLLAEINPQVRSALAHTAETLRDDYAALESALPVLTPSHVGLSVDRATFLRLPVALQRLLIRAAAQRLAPDSMLSLERTEAALAKSLTGRPTKISLGGGLWFTVHSSEISITNMPTRPYPPDCPSLPTGSSISIDGTGLYPLPDDHWQLKVERLQVTTENDPLSVVLAIAEYHRLVLRTRYSGDRFKPVGLRGHSQKLKETLINIKMPSEWRDQMPLIAVDDEIAWFIAPTERGPIQRIGHTFVPDPAKSHPLWRFSFARAFIDESL